VIILTGFLIGIFHVATFFRKLFLGNFLTSARKSTLDGSEELIGSAQGQMNAIKASLEKQ
jgi:hypothetical protein